MAKKKAKKKVTRKAAPRKKAAARRSAKKKIAAKSRRTTRKPAMKSKRRSAPAKTSAPRKSPVAKTQAVAPKEFTVDPGECKITPSTHNVAPKIIGGSVQFNATSACSVEFSDPKVLGLGSPTLPLVQGPNGPYPVQVELGVTQVRITVCTRGTGSDPSDIIVP